MKGVFYMPCPGCGLRVRARTQMIGRYCYCPGCSARILVTAPQAEQVQRIAVPEPQERAFRLVRRVREFSRSSLLPQPHTPPPVGS